MTMNRKLQNDIERWLKAEALGDSAEAEARFAAAFAALPHLEPRAGFATRVMYGFQPALARRFEWLTWGWRAAMLGALALVAIVMGLLPAARITFRLPPVGTLLDAATGGITWLAEWLATGLEVWSFLVRIGHAIGVAVTTPQLGAALVASALVGAVALYELNRLLVPERRTA